MKLAGIKNIIFDLGAVLINIDFQFTYQEFAKLCNTDILTVIRRFRELRIFERYEIGEFDDGQFRDFVRAELNPNLSDVQIDKAWNALLLDIPLQRIELLKRLKQSYRLFLLSNTNNIHIVEVNRILMNTCGLQNWNPLFEKVYYSYNMGMSKPDVKIYERVLKENSLVAQETLFVDDNLDNIKGAGQAGIQTLHLQLPQSVTDHFLI